MLTSIVAMDSVYYGIQRERRKEGKRGGEEKVLTIRRHLPHMCGAGATSRDLKKKLTSPQAIKNVLVTNPL